MAPRRRKGPLDRRPLLWESVFKDAKSVMKGLRHVTQVTSTSAAGAETTTPDIDCSVAFRGRRSSELSSSTHRPSKGVPPVDPFIEHDEIRRQERMADKYERIFLKQKDTSHAEGCCDSCSRINLEAIYADQGVILEEITGFSLQDIGVIDETWHKRSCQLCRLFAATWEKNKAYLRSSNLCLVILSSRNISKYTAPIKIPKSVGYHNILLLSHPQPRRVFNVDQATLDNLDIVGPLFLSKAKVHVKNCVSVRYLQQDKVDFSIVRGWLQFCNGHHANACYGSEMPNMTGFQLLNCNTRELEAYVPGTKFVALSYVWGPNVSEQMYQSDGQCHSILPKTIEDAVRVTLEIGFHYIWIDRFCIPQHNQPVKHMQIANLDLVYSCAELTIVAASGQDSAFGLPGVNNRSRVPQATARVGDYDIVSGLSNPIRDVESSKWITRGWTYQEALLSKRRLIFTSKQVYFECSGMTCTEAIAEPKELMVSQAAAVMKRERQYGNIGTLLDRRHRLFPANYLDQLREEPWLIQHLIAEYTARSLTFESDTLSAFLGILRNFRHPQCPVSHLWGVPVLWSSEKWSAMEGFATGLCWAGRFPEGERIRRRPGFPSWSWAGWRIHVSLKNYFYRYGFKTPYDIDIKLETEHGEILPWATYQARFAAGEAPSLSQYLHVEGWSLKCNVSHNQLLTVEGTDTELLGVSWHKAYSADMKRNRIWDVIVIGNPEDAVTGAAQFFEEYPPFGPFLMILENMGEFYERVGHLDLAHSHPRQDSYVLGAESLDMSIYLAGKKRRSFRLG